jgi:hypothetical protein
MTEQGFSVAISNDGSTVLVGGTYDNDGMGAAWVFARSDGAWIQQGNKLVGSGATYRSYQGQSVALSGDGTTALVAGNGDNNFRGAVWVFERSGGVWIQQGEKLVGSGPSGKTYMGTAMALSNDGNTAVVGGPEDSGAVGAAWIFVRSNGVWTQQGEKLVGSGAVDLANQGTSVSISADGNTVAVGGSTDNYLAGAVWIFTRTGAVWTQQGPKLIPPGNLYHPLFGRSVALSGDGSVLLVGTSYNDIEKGGGWVFKRSNGVWSQYGGELVGSDAEWNARQGWACAMSASGNTCAIGGYNDGGGAGGMWVYAEKFLVVTVNDPATGAPVAKQALVRLYNGSQLLDARFTDSLSSATFYGETLSENCYYTVHVLDSSALGHPDTLYWGKKLLPPTGSSFPIIENFFRTTPYIENADLIDGHTSSSVAGDTVYAGIPLRYEVALRNPGLPGGESFGARCGIALDTGVTRGQFSLTFSDEETIPAHAAKSFIIPFTPITPGMYHYTASALATVDGVGILTDVKANALQWNFTVVMPPIPGLPVLVSPGAEAADQPITLKLVWHNVIHATEYHVQMSTDSMFASGTGFIDSTVTDTSLAVAGLANKATYYWRVSASNISGFSEYSVRRVIHTIVKPPANPVLNLPANGATQIPTTTTLRWRNTADAVTYHLVVGTDSIFSGGQVLSDSSIADTSRLITGLTYATRFFWRVRGRNVAGYGAWSGPWQFHTLDADPAIPKLLSPANGTAGVDTPAVVTWTRPAGATSFHLQVCGDSNFTPALMTSDIQTTDTSVVLHNVKLLSTYWWHVNATHPQTGTSPYSPTWRFVTGLVQPGVVVLIEPVQNGAVVADTLRLRWRLTGPFVDRYWLEYGIDSAFVVKGVDSTLTDTTMILRSMVKNTDYYWRVRAHNALGWGAFCQKWKFYRSLTDVPGESPRLPDAYVLSQNYPNPFNPSTTIRYGLPVHSHVKLSVFNVLSEEVAVLQNGEQDAGFHEVKFNGMRLASGVYFYRIQITPRDAAGGDRSAGDASTYVETKKLVLTK